MRGYFKQPAGHIPTTTSRLKLVVGDLAIGNAKAGQHFEAGFDHLRRSTEIEFHRVEILPLV
jgi:hypothetical protein